MEQYVDKSVSQQTLKRFFQQCLAANTQVQSLIIFQGDKKLVRLAPQPYSCENKGQLYSLSKSFTSTAIGFLVDEKILSVEEKIIDIFPDKCPEQISEHLSEMRVRHVLSMNTGHDQCVMPEIKEDSDGVRAFLSAPVEHKPGTHFAYNTAATYLLSAIVTRRTGVSLLDYLNRKLFIPLGITNVRWRKYGGEICEGGVGAYLSCDDIIKLGRLYLGNGVFEGKRILSEEWVKEATMVHSDNSSNGTPDWSSGYGYQFWKNAREGFRGDGAYGQLCCVFPERNLTVAVKAETYDMQGEVDLVCDLVDGLFQKSDSDDILPTIDSLYPPLRCEAAPRISKLFSCQQDVVGMSQIYLHTQEEQLIMQFSDGEFLQDVCCGNGTWIENKIHARGMLPTLIRLIDTNRREELHFAASYTVKENSIIMQWRYLDTPHKFTVRLEMEEGGALLYFQRPGEDLIKEPMRVWKLRQLF